MKKIMVSFLTLGFVMMMGMSESAHALITSKPAEVAAAKALFLKTCYKCHGKTAGGMDDTAPKLSSQNKYFVAQAIKDFQSGARYPKHKTVVAGLDSRARLAMGTYLEGLAGGGEDGTLPAVKNTHNIEKFFWHKCAMCHGQNVEGTDFGPRLREQWPFYLEQEIANFSKEDRPLRMMAGHLFDLDQDAGLRNDLISYLQAGLVRE